MEDKYHEIFNKEIERVKKKKKFSSLDQIAGDIKQFCIDNSIPYDEKKMEEGKPPISKQTLHTFTYKGGNTPSYETIRILCQYFDIPADYLMGLPLTRSPNKDVKTAAQVLGVEQDETVDAIKRVFAVLSTQIIKLSSGNLSGKELQPLVEAVIQSPYFITMFQGYMLFIDYYAREYAGDGEPQDFYHSELFPDTADDTPYYAQAVIMANAYEAAKSIKGEIEKYCKPQAEPDEKPESKSAKAKTAPARKAASTKQKGKAK